MKKYFAILGVLYIGVASADADIAGDENIDVQIQQARIQLDELQSKLDNLDAELTTCRKSLTTGKIVTAIGVGGVVGTGIGAAVLGTKIHKERKKIAEKEASEQSGQEEQK